MTNENKSLGSSEGALSAEKCAADAVRQFCIAYHLKGRPHSACTLSADDLPTNYGDYSVWDGVDLIAGGSTRNLRSSFQEYEHRLQNAAVPIFIWKPDTDGHIAKWLDGPREEAEPDPDECSECDGTGEIICPECDGTGIAS